MASATAATAAATAAAISAVAAITPTIATARCTTGPTTALTTGTTALVSALFVTPTKIGQFCKEIIESLPHLRKCESADNQQVRAGAVQYQRRAA